MFFMNILNVENKYNKYVLFILIFLTFFVTLNVLPPLDRDESRYMQSTLQMIETGDFLNINFLDSPRNKKPPGIYWLQAFSALSVKNIFSLNEIPIWSYRLPSAIGASIAIWITFLIGRVLYGREVGFLAAVLLLATPLVFAESHIAKTDSCLLAFILFPLLVISKIIVGLDNKSNMPSSSYIYCGWFVLGFSLIIKGPIGLFILFLTILFTKLVNNNFRFTYLKPAKGLLFYILGGLPCFLWVYYIGTNDFVQESIFSDMIMKVLEAKESHGAFPGFYILTSFLSCWPLSLFFIPSAIWAYKNREDNKIIFLLCWLIPSWIIFELIPTKLLHYILPLLPSLSILSAAMIMDFLKNNNFLFLDKKLYKLAVFFSTLAPVFLAYIIFYIGLKYMDHWIIFSILITIIYFIAFLISVYFLYKRRFVLVALLASLINIFCLSSFLVFISPQLKTIWISEKIYEYVEKHKIERPVILLGYSEPSAVFRLGSDTFIANTVEQSLLYLENGKKFLLVVEKKFEKEFFEKTQLAALKLYKHDYKISGINYSKGKKVLLSIYSN